MKRVVLLMAMALGASCADGTPGMNGVNGKDGSNGKDGANGTNGKDGANGSNGKDGANGSNGKDGATLIISDRAKHGLDISPVPLKLTGLDAAQVEAIGQGSYLVNAVITCSSCHSPDPTPGHFMAGGAKFPLGPDGSFVTSRNLTPDPTTGLPGSVKSADDFVKVFRTGADLRNPGQQILVMPWANFRWMSESDIRAIYAYLTVLPPVVNAIDKDQKGALAAIGPVPYPATYDEGDQPRAYPPEFDPLGNPVPDPDSVLRGLAIQPLAVPDAVKTLTPSEQALFGRGVYLVNAAACNDCHTNQPRDLRPGPTYLKVNTARYLTGGQIFPTPVPYQPFLGTTRAMSANLLGSDHGFFNEVDTDFVLFAGILTQAAHIDDNPPRPLAFPMPADHFRFMTLNDLAAVFTYLKTLATNAAPHGAGDVATQSATWLCGDAAHACPSGQTCHLDAALGNECVGASCHADADCAACQHCTGASPGVAGACAVPDPTNTTDAACLAGGI